MKGLAAVVLASASLAALAGDAPRWYLHHDNDVVFATDRWYTSGVRLARVQDRGDYARLAVQLGAVRSVRVGRLATGVGTMQRWGSALFALAIDTREFDGQRVPHRFGSLVIHLDF